ncbi:MAG: CocE/NonD family hydrolase C-terminal non-catalytic domain-containing protein, partial [Pseudomonadota bacterium]
TSTLISRGVLNLCHRTGHETPAPVIPGEEMDVSIALDETAYRVRPGHCLRLAISTAYWPLVVPSPAPVTAALASGTLTLPSVPNSERIDVPAPADPSPLPEYPEIAPGARKRWTETDPDSGRIRYNLLEDTGHHRHPRHAMEVRETREESWEIDPGDPSGATGSLTMTTLRQRDTWRAQTVAKVHFTAQADRYLVDATLEASTDDVAFAARRWSFSVARKMV